MRLPLSTFPYLLIYRYHHPFVVVCSPLRLERPFLVSRFLASVSTIFFPCFHPTASPSVTSSTRTERFSLFCCPPLIPLFATLDDASITHINTYIYFTKKSISKKPCHLYLYINLKFISTRRPPLYPRLPCVFLHQYTGLYHGPPTFSTYISRWFGRACLVFSLLLLFPIA